MFEVNDENRYAAKFRPLQNVAVPLFGKKSLNYISKWYKNTP